MLQAVGFGLTVIRLLSSRARPPRMQLAEARRRSARSAIQTGVRRLLVGWNADGQVTESGEPPGFRRSRNREPRDTSSDRFRFPRARTEARAGEAATGCPRGPGRRPTLLTGVSQELRFGALSAEPHCSCRGPPPPRARERIWTILLDSLFSCFRRCLTARAARTRRHLIKSKSRKLDF